MYTTKDSNDNFSLLDNVGYLKSDNFDDCLIKKCDGLAFGPQCESSVDNNELLEKISKLESDNRELREQVGFLERDSERLMRENNSLRSKTIEPESKVAVQLGKEVKSIGRRVSSRPLSTMKNVLNKRNSLGYQLNESSLISQSSEVDVLRNNVQEYIACIKRGELGSSISSNHYLFVEVISCLMALFHENITLRDRQEPITQSNKQLQDIFFEITRFISNLISSFTSTNFEQLSFPMKWLLKSFPDYSETVEGRGWLPLHWYMATPSPSPDKIAVLMEIFGEDSFEEAVSPLSILVSNRSINSSETSTRIICVLEELLKHRPQAASDRDADGSVAIMHACAAAHPSIDIIDKLYSRYPAGIDISDNFGCYAIHYACYSSNIQTVKYLLEKNSQSIRFTSGNGALPLHEAIQNTSSDSLHIELVQYIHALYPEASSIADHQGALPLHLAARFSNLDIVKFLYNTYPKAIVATDLENLTPIHYSSQRLDKSVDIIDFLAQSQKTYSQKISTQQRNPSPVKEKSKVSFVSAIKAWSTRG